MNVPAGINLNFMPIELADSGNSTGVGAGVVGAGVVGAGVVGAGVVGAGVVGAGVVGAGVVGAGGVGAGGVGAGGVGRSRSHPQIATTATQTTAELKRFTFAPVVKGYCPATA